MKDYKVANFNINELRLFKKFNNVEERGFRHTDVHFAANKAEINQQKLLEDSYKQLKIMKGSYYATLR
ncbi:hypothetical protein IMX26_10545 [Clostridium sp. 'deep sea']|uniref:hypothetical protein n=1 Tax=Clostridium sp. 'deep sea' TaxID=2779445 RepID=UPI001896909A|nr:hypothetical protein [Clostridium sp. 'deep sea']QOR33930.1 hypothetical protein IMX26_10545 [Clostridium sp. 'deep sea']